MDAYLLELALTGALAAAIMAGWCLRWLWERLGPRSDVHAAAARIAGLEAALAAAEARAVAAEGALDTEGAAQSSPTAEPVSPDERTGGHDKPGALG